MNYILIGKLPTPEPDIKKWAQWYEKSGEKRRVGLTELPNNIKVSTVFLGIDHKYGDGPPELFETMIFGGEHNEYCERYATWDDAYDGHKRALTMVQKTTNN